MPAERSGPLPWGQYLNWVFQQVAMGIDRSVLIAVLDVELPRRITPAAVLAAVDTLVTRHEALHTTIAVDRVGSPVQTVHRVNRSERGYRVVEHGPESTDLSWLTAPFDLASEWPVRVALHTAADGALRLRLAVNRVFVDFHAEEAMMAELHALLAVGEDAARLAPVTWHPLDIVELEQSPAGTLANQRAMAHWARGLETLPHNYFPAARAVREDTDHGIRISLRSHELRPAVRDLATALRITEPTLLTTVFAVTLALFTGRDRYTFTVLSPNRTRRGMRGAICSLSDRALLFGVVDRSSSFADQVREVHGALLLAYRHGHYDPGDMRALLAETATRRGIYLHQPALLNIVLKDQARSPEADEQVVVDHLPFAYDGMHLELTVQGDQLVTVKLLVGEHIMTAADGQRFVALWRHLLLVAAAHPDHSLADLAGGDAASRPLLVDHCVVDISAIADSVRDLPGVIDAELFLTDGPQPLRAELTCADPRVTPGVLRELMQPVLGDRPGLMCPHQFVVCSRAPGEPDRADGVGTNARREGSGWPPERVSPGTPAEHAVAEALLHTHPHLAEGKDAADVGVCYLMLGGRFERVPAFLQRLSELGYAGVNADTLLGPGSLRMLADRLVAQSAGAVAEGPAESAVHR
jgi:hypothetical protein